MKNPYLDLHNRNKTSIPAGTFHYYLNDIAWQIVRQGDTPFDFDIIATVYSDVRAYEICKMFNELPMQNTFHEECLNALRFKFDE